MFTLPTKVFWPIYSRARKPYDELEEQIASVLLEFT
jgi:hypothetical protein